MDIDDIKRLKKELFWAPGKCAYCNGLGKVPPDRIEKLDPDVEYLTTDLPSWERHKVITGDDDAMKRAREFKETVLAVVEEIEQMYYIENKEPCEIAGHLFHKQGRFVYSASEKQEMVEYVEKVINSKLKK
ncbi:hypothetical protein [Niastella populi]|uniref:hypothetical protein n=1 Tax=Niastella populi TaxID=550983 RepID=UPI0013FDE177|nr:hypothetical protein [Niastella populi]